VPGHDRMSLMSAADVMSADMATAQAEEDGFGSSVAVGMAEEYLDLTRRRTLLSSGLVLGHVLVSNSCAIHLLHCHRDYYCC
jgi:hypothetical protein